MDARGAPYLTSVLALLSVLVLCGGITGRLMATPTVKITLHQQAQIRGTQILLGDIAQIQASEALMASLQQVRIADAPAVGKSRTLYQPHIRTRLIQSKLVPNADVYITGERVTIQTLEHVWTAEVILQHAQDFLRQQFANPSLRIRLVNPIQPIAIADDNAQIRFRWASSPPEQLTNTAMSLHAEIASGSQIQQRSIVVVEPCVQIQVAVTKRPLPIQHVIALVDVSLVEQEAGTPATAVIGHTTRRALAKGEIIQASDVQQVLLIRQNQEIAMIVQIGRLQVKAQGHALEAGRYGQKIRVHNPKLAKDQVGVVIGRGQVLLLRANHP